MDIELIGLNRESAVRGFRPSLTCNFTICEGANRTHAEVIFVDGCDQVIERQGKDAKRAARMALEQLLLRTAHPFSSLLFVRISSNHAAYFAKHGGFHQSLLV